jgi:hypothetical protein
VFNDRYFMASGVLNALNTLLLLKATVAANTATML